MGWGVLQFNWVSYLHTHCRWSVVGSILRDPVAGLQHYETGIASCRPIMPGSCSFLATSPILAAHIASTASADAPSGSLVQSLKHPSLRPSA